MLRLVIVEDEEIIRRGMVCTIDWLSMGCVVVGDAADGVEGLALIEKERPDVVLTDIRMPRLDGIEMAKQALEKGLLRHLVFLTSFAEFDYAKQAIELQAADYLLKPVDEKELAGLMARLAQKSVPEETPAAPALLAEWQDWLAADGLNPYVRQSLERIQTDYCEKLSIEQLAEEYGVSASYLSRKFKEAMGHTFVEILNRQRIQKSMQQLAEGTYRVYEVAEQNGFSDYKNFCTVFKKYVQLSPKEFMKQAQGVFLR